MKHIFQEASMYEGAVPYRCDPRCEVETLTNRLHLALQYRYPA